MQIMWFIVGTIVVIAAIMGLVAFFLNPKTPTGTATTPPGATPAVTPTPTLWNQVKAWYAEEWIKASVGGVILIILLTLLNRNLAWWLSGHHPLLFISLILLVVLGVFVLKKDYDRTKKWLWRAGFAIVLVFGVGGAILEDRHNGEPNLDEAIVGGEQREALKEVAQEVAAAMPEISMPSFPSLSPVKTTQAETAEITVATMKPHVIYPNQWTEIVLRPGLKNELLYEGSAQFADRSGNILYEGPYSPYMMNDVTISRLWVRSLDQTKSLTQATPG